MNKTSKNTNKENMEKSIGHIMRIGVLISAALMLFGFILLCINTDETLNGFENIDLLKITIGLAQLNPYSYMMIGIFIMILTPVIRVVSTIVLFAIEKDKMYTLITLFVFIILMISFVVGLINH